MKHMHRACIEHASCTCSSHAKAVAVAVAVANKTRFVNSNRLSALASKAGIGELEATPMTITAVSGACFRCGGWGHWADDCDTLIPAKTKAEHEARIEKYVKWFRDDDPPRITPHQKRQLIEHENRMWRDAAPKGARK